MWVDGPLERLTLETMYSAFIGPNINLPEPVTFQDPDPLGANIVPVVTSGDNMAATTVQHNCKVMCSIYLHGRCCCRVYLVIKYISSGILNK